MAPVVRETLFRDQWICFICDEEFNKDGHRPVFLPCFHTFGFQCIKRLVSNKGSQLRCPSCHKSFQTPENGLESLPRNAYVDYHINMYKDRADKSESHWYFKLKEKIQVPNQHLAVAEKLKALDEKLMSLLLVSLTKRREVHKHLQKRTNQLKSKRRAALKPLVDQNINHLRRLKSTLDSLNASHQKGNSATELALAHGAVSEAKVTQLMKKLLAKAAAIISAKEDVRLANELHIQIIGGAQKNLSCRKSGPWVITDCSKKPNEEPDIIIVSSPFSVDCCSVRFGSYHTSPIGKVEFSSDALTLIAPVWKKENRTDPDQVKFTFRFEDVLEGKYHLSSEFCAIFINLYRTEKWCLQLGLVDNDQSPYWVNRNGSDSKQKWLVLVLPGSLPLLLKDGIKEILASSTRWITFREINLIEACAALMLDHPLSPKHHDLNHASSVPTTRNSKRFDGDVDMLAIGEGFQLINAFVTHHNKRVDPFTIQVTLSDSIESINAQIEAITGIPVSQQTLVISGKYLQTGPASLLSHGFRNTKFVRILLMDKENSLAPL